MDSAESLRPPVVDDESAIVALVRELKTQQAVADLFGVTQGAVSQWRNAGIPLARRFQVKRQLEARGYDVPADFVERAIA